jgi:dihydroneopterin aldolase
MDRDQFGRDGAPVSAGPIARVFLRDLVLEAMIGVHRHEAVGPQRIVVNIELSVRLPEQSLRDKLSEVVDYEGIANGVRAIIARGHVKLVETLAERIAEYCLEDARVEAVLIRVEKTEAIEGARGAGVEISRRARTV